MGTFPAYEVPDIQTGPNGRRYPRGSVPDGFAPKYLCLVYMKLARAGITVQHAYFPMTSDFEAIAVAEFSSVTESGEWATRPISSNVSFENFTFNSQQLILFYLDPAEVPAEFDPENLVQFAEWSARGPKTPVTRKARNNCFLNPQLRSWPRMEVLTLENWYVDDWGQPIPPGVELYYTMNLHALLPYALPGSVDGLSDLPLVLDPDTGNMGGDP